MQKLRWLVCGAVLGFVAAHFVNRTPEGRRFFDRVNRGIAEFNRAFDKGYHEGDPVHLDVEAALSSLPDKR
ncbi:hypothetical protein G7067_09740 [Leucobacter insecticola]|uniref:Uncharacterized protein n=1 Tax=Leucobacter insecticola TaxID=2714934 RepID=A0A6G8FK02_9MICO|nr:hypothetical protein [Leucobacter insecticola]QIM16623.1 hypothetical protein G7067_09740 [Leucobacter insecticola]